MAPESLEGQYWDKTRWCDVGQVPRMGSPEFWGLLRPHHQLAALSWALACSLWALVFLIFKRVQSSFFKIFFLLVGRGTGLSNEILKEKPNM